VIFYIKGYGFVEFKTEDDEESESEEEEEEVRPFLIFMHIHHVVEH
jgi:hypothetical protein